MWDLTPGVNEGEPQEDGSERKKKRRKQAPGTVIVKVGLKYLSCIEPKVLTPLLTPTDPRLGPEGPHWQGLARPL